MLLKEFFQWLKKPISRNFIISNRILTGATCLMWLFFIRIPTAGINMNILQHANQSHQIITISLIVGAILGTLILMTQCTTCLGGIIAAICILAEQSRSPFLGIGPEYLIPHMLIFTSIARIDRTTRLSIDTWSAKLISVYAINIIFCAGISKIISNTWLQRDHIVKILLTPASSISFINPCNHPQALHIIAYYIIFCEVAAPIMLLFPRIRRAGLMAILTIFIGIVGTLQTALFGFTMIVMLLPLVEDVFLGSAMHVTRSP